MSETLDLDAIRARVDAATPGPWGVGNDTTIVRGLEVTGPGSYSCISSVAEVTDEDDRIGWADNEPDQYTLVNPEADAEFIAAARQDVPALLAEVQRLYLSEAMLRRRIVALERLAACYRIGSRPTEALLKELDATHAGVMAP